MSTGSFQLERWGNEPFLYDQKGGWATLSWTEKLRASRINILL